MATEQRTPAVAGYEISVHWSEHEAPVVAHLDPAQALELVARMAAGIPAELEHLDLDDEPRPEQLLLGLQSFYRLTVQGGGCLNLADTAGDLWAIPARAVQGVRVRLLMAPRERRSGTRIIPLPTPAASPSC